MWIAPGICIESLLTPWREGASWFLAEELVLGQEVGAAKALRAIVDFVSGNERLQHKGISRGFG